MILDYRPSLKKPPQTAQRGGPSSGHHGTEEPPPYTNHAQESPLPPVPRASGSRLPPPSPVHPRSASSSRFTELPQEKKAPVPEPPESPASATISQLHLISKQEPLIGTFFVDPRIQNLTQTKRKKKGNAPVIPHATFRTTSGPIQIGLGSTGDVRETPKATMSVASTSGDIEIELMPIHTIRPRVGLEVMSRQGDITVYVPETFSGLIQLNTRSGDIHVLPALMSRIKVLKATNKETIILMGASGVGPVVEGPHSLTDLCQLTSRSGKVIVGLSGLDRVQEKEGFWKKLGQFFRG